MSAPEPGFVYGLQAASWRSGEIIERGLTKIGFTRRTVSERVAEMQSALGAGGVHRLLVAFEVPVADIRVERAVHAVLKSEGRHISAGNAVEWFSIEPDEAEALVTAFATSARDVDAALEDARRRSAAPRNRSSIRGKKEIKMTPTRAAALDVVRHAAASGGSASDFAGGRWGAAATALAVEEGISKEAALIVMRDWFLP
jgi:hypothetical protein